MRVYIETTVPSYVVARPARDVLQAAQHEFARVWWERERTNHELFTSQVVLDEISFGEPEMAKRRSKVMENIPILEAIPSAEQMAFEILEHALPQKAYQDAAHIALATVHRMDVLLTWNCRHIANVHIHARLWRIAERLGFSLPTLCTPQEMMDLNNE